MEKENVLAALKRLKIRVRKSKKDEKEFSLEIMPSAVGSVRDIAKALEVKISQSFAGQFEEMKIFEHNSTKVLNLSGCSGLLYEILIEASHMKGVWV